MDVSLKLRDRQIAYSDRAGSPVPFPVVQRQLGNMSLTLDREHHRTRRVPAGVLGRVILEPTQKGRRFVLETDAQKCIDRKGGIAHPGVAIIPVANASDDLR